MNTKNTSTLKYIISVLLFAVLFFVLSARPSFAASSEYTKITVKKGSETVSTDAWEFQGTPYIAISTLKEYGDCSSFTIDEKAKRIYFKLSDMNIYIVDDETTSFIKNNGGTCYIYVKVIDNKNYVALNAITQIAKLGYEFDGSTVYLAPYANADNIAVIKNDTTAAESVINGQGRNLELKKGQIVFVDSRGSFSSSIRTIAGDICYIANKAIAPVSDSSDLLDFQYTAKTNQDFSGKFNLTWHNMAGTTLDPPDETGGIDVVAPTWCRQIVNGGGDVTNYCNKGYVDRCHDRGFKVWLCITNNMATSGATNYTSKVLADSSLRNKTIAQYLFYAALYDMDGINVDYESLKNTDRENFTAFAQTLGKYTKKLGLSYSICLPPVATWYVEYDYEALGACSDYICMMTYDQNVSNAGSGASFDWVESSVQTMLNYVPSGKIMLGIPFYARVWTISGSKATSKTQNLDSLKSTVASWGVTPTWNPSNRQYIASHGSQKIWLEDTRSIANKMTLVYSYDLAGTCCWSHGSANDTIYQLFEDVYKYHVDPDTVTPEF